MSQTTVISKLVANNSGLLGASGAAALSTFTAGLYEIPWVTLGIFIIIAIFAGIIGQFALAPVGQINLSSSIKSGIGGGLSGSVMSIVVVAMTQDFLLGLASAILFGAMAERGLSALATRGEKIAAGEGKTRSGRPRDRDRSRQRDHYPGRHRKEEPLGPED